MDEHPKQATDIQWYVVARYCSSPIYDIYT